MSDAELIRAIEGALEDTSLSIPMTFLLNLLKERLEKDALE